MLLAALPLAAEEIYQDPRAFLLEVFDGELPAAGRLWITDELKPDIRAIMNRDLRRLRVRYWRRGGRVAWILEEIGKDQPITTGVIVDGASIEDIRVLIYRESRGWEVRFPAFRDQFHGATLTPARDLNRPIDGITGATLSVRAMKRLARLALFLTECLPPAADAS